MAHMIPPIPRECTAESRESEVFQALEKLPDEYYVVHSFNILHIKCCEMEEGEIDFVVFHPQKGILCIECKAGAVSYRNGRWFYASGLPMKGDGPYLQAAENRFKLMRKIRALGREELLEKCKILHAVWFPSISKMQFQNIPLPMEADPKITLTQDSLLLTQRDLKPIFTLHPTKSNAPLSEEEIEFLLKRVIQPEMCLVPNIQDGEKTLARLFRQQVRILDILEEQRYAVIHGMAGTGKTLLAIEKARRLADCGERVLFLCFNLKLWNHLNRCCSHPNIDYRAIAEWGKEKAGKYNDYAPLADWLDHAFGTDEFPYQHVVIDEGQDFGIPEIEAAHIGEKLRDWILRDENPNGTFYVFCDKYQLVHGGTIPKFIQDVDCKLTLFKNCRNTLQILKTSMVPLGPISCASWHFEGCLNGERPQIFFSKDSSDLAKMIEDRISVYRESGIQNEDIVILTTKTSAQSMLNQNMQFKGNEYYFVKKKRSILFTTCRKFKGLEAVAVLLVDVDEECFSQEESMARNLFYVGASRAKQKLSVFCTFNEESCKKLLTNIGEIPPDVPPQQCVATLLQATWNP